MRQRSASEESGNTPFVASRATFEFSVKQVIQSGDIALMHTR